MTAKAELKSDLKGKARMRQEALEAMLGLKKVGAVTDDEIRMTTLRMVGRKAFPIVLDLAPADIVTLREEVGVSQAVMAGFLNVAVKTVSQWERGERKPTGAALKLLNVVKRRGVEALR